MVDSPKRTRIVEVLMTGASAVSSSTAAGGTGTVEHLRQAYVRLQIFVSTRRVRPEWIVLKRLAAKLFGDAEALGRSEAQDALAPIGILVLPHGLPVSRDVRLDVARDHHGHCTEGRVGRLDAERVATLAGRS
jgi:hypothetical protein